MIRTYPEALAYLADEKREIHLQLDRMEKLLDVLGHPERALSCVHIAGTNGKGSILAYLTSALSGAGFRVGSYSSPVVYYYREQFRVNGHPVSEEEFTSLTETIRVAVETLEEEGVERPSSFELETCLAILFFRAQQCDIVILECGMGGRDDATNAIPAPLLTVFASIDMDHAQYLGDSIEAITRVKSGIIKPGTGAAVSGPQIRADILEEACTRCDVPLRLWKSDDIEETKLSPDGTEVTYRGTRLRSPLAGAFQVPNLITAYEALLALREQGLTISDEQILDGLRNTVWPGRMARISERPEIYVDGAHNPAAAKQLARTLKEVFADRRWIFLAGVFRDKDVRGIVEEMRGIADHIYTVAAPDNLRAMSPEALAEIFREAGEQATACESIPQALGLAVEEAGDDFAVLAFGSLSFLAAVEEAARV